VGKGGDEVYIPVYHPDAAGPDSALAVEVTAGNEVRSIDFRLRKTKGYRIHGRVAIGGETEGRMRPAQVMLAPQGGGSRFFPPRGGTIANAQGEFEVPAVPPGSYTLVAVVFENDTQLIGTAPVHVSGDDVEGVVIALAPGFEVTGTITAEGNPADFDATRVNLNLMPAGDEVAGMFMSGGGARGEKDGKFRIPRVAPSRYQVSAVTRLEGYYVKAIRYGNQDVLGQEFDLSGPSQLEIVLSPGAATLGGAVQDAKGNPASGALVWLASKSAPNRQDLQKVATTDQNGNFELKGIAPGEYLVFAFEDAEMGGLMDPESRKPFEGKASSVKLSERGRESLQIKVIPPI
jgi:hypothetical protein